LSEHGKVLLRQFHKEAVAASPAPAIALNAANEPLAVVVDLNEGSLAASPVAVVVHAFTVTFGRSR
jgi:hypothetical protein